MPRLRRRKLTPKQERLREVFERAAARLRILGRGVAHEIEHIYDAEDYRRILDFMATDLTPAVKNYEQTEKAYHAGFTRRAGVRVHRNPK